MESDRNMSPVRMSSCALSLYKSCQSGPSFLLPGCRSTAFFYKYSSLCFWSWLKCNPAHQSRGQSCTTHWLLDFAHYSFTAI